MIQSSRMLERTVPHTAWRACTASGVIGSTASAAHSSGSAKPVGSDSASARGTSGTLACSARSTSRACSTNRISMNSAITPKIRPSASFGLAWPEPIVVAIAATTPATTNTPTMPNAPIA
jgi:hypothetical protein